MNVKYNKKIKDEVRKRKIEYLYHFTRYENIESILSRGLLSREMLEMENISCNYNDENRYDRCFDCVNTSVSFPDYKMLSKYRKAFKDADWVIFKIDAKVLYERECFFAKTNTTAKKQFTNKIKEHTDIKSFKSLFNQIHEKGSRAAMGIDDNMPTNPQAEVFLLEGIDLSDICEIVFENKKLMEKFKREYSTDIELSVDINLFKTRKDAKYWN